LLSAVALAASVPGKCRPRWNRPLGTSRKTSQAIRRFAILLGLASVVAGCADPARPVMREGDSPRPYMQFSVVVDRANGSLGPAQSRADAICADVLQSAVMYRATDVGDDRTQYYFRCR